MDTNEQPVDIFGYEKQFEANLASIGNISSKEFLNAHKFPQYLEKLSYDPTTSKHYDLIDTDIVKFNKQQQEQRKYGYRRIDAKLNDKELNMFKKNGFVVCESKSFNSFGNAYHSIYSDDLPVFVTADSVLHAWHYSFDNILMAIETNVLGYQLVTVLNGLKEQIRSHLTSGVNDPLMQACVKDADFFLTVATCLLKRLSTALSVKVDDDLIFQENAAHLKQTLTAIKEESMIDFEIFGTFRKYDFSQFIPRGHYTKSQLLTSYFQAMMWLGRTEIILVGKDSSIRQVAVAALFHYLLKMAKLQHLWQDFDKTIQTFVGITDSMNFNQLAFLVDKSGTPFPFAEADITKLKTLIQNSDFGKQAIMSQPIFTPFGDKQIELPQVFLLMGQKFTVDSFALGKVVFDRIMYKGKKVERRHPSCLDVAYSVFGNDHIAPNLVESNAKYPYFHNLLAVRKTVDAQESHVWKQNIYMAWLSLLRELSVPTTDVKYPEVMRTHAWAMKDTETQMASWSQLRHDTILYVKQSYGAFLCCEYPKCFVDPRPEFWRKFTEMATSTAQMISALKVPNTAGYVKFFTEFGATTEKLRAIAEKQVEQKPLTDSETAWLKTVVNIRSGGSGPPTYTGWYCNLFVTCAEDSCKEEFIVADVHTNPPDDYDPGHVLHQGIGKVNLMVMSVNSGNDKVAYVAPVFSHYEFEMQGLNRRTDEQWSEMVEKDKLPARPSWTQSYLSPKK